MEVKQGTGAGLRITLVTEEDFVVGGFVEER